MLSCLLLIIFIINIKALFHSTSQPGSPLKSTGKVLKNTYFLGHTPYEIRQSVKGGGVWWAPWILLKHNRIQNRVGPLIFIPLPGSVLGVVVWGGHGTGCPGGSQRTEHPQVEHTEWRFTAWALGSDRSGFRQGPPLLHLLILCFVLCV